MALVPVIQPPIMKLLTTKAERQIVMKELRPVSRKEKIAFPFVVTIFVSLLVPSAAPLVGSLMLGNLQGMRRLRPPFQDRSERAHEHRNYFPRNFRRCDCHRCHPLSLDTIKIIVMGVIAFGFGTAGGVLLAKFMNPLPEKQDQSAYRLRWRFRSSDGCARITGRRSERESLELPSLMHAMGPNVAGVIGSAIAAGVLIALFG